MQGEVCCVCVCVSVSVCVCEGVSEGVRSREREREVECVCLFNCVPNQESHIPHQHSFTSALAKPQNQTDRLDCALSLFLGCRFALVSGRTQTASLAPGHTKAMAARLVALLAVLCSATPVLSTLSMPSTLPSCRPRTELAVDVGSSLLIGSNFDTDKYTSDTRCEWLIRAPQGANLVIQVLSMVTECVYDSVYVYDGGTHDAPLLAVLSGSQQPPPLVLSSNKVWCCCWHPCFHISSNLVCVCVFFFFFFFFFLVCAMV